MKIKNKLFVVLIVILINSCKQSATFTPNLIPVKSNDKWGYIDDNGKYIINPQFAYAGYFSDKLAVVSNTENKYGYVNEKGEYIINPQYLFALSFSEEMACVVSEGGVPKFINSKGELKFELANAIEVGSFHNGLARFKDEKDKWGYIDKEEKLKSMHSLIMLWIFMADLRQ